MMAVIIRLRAFICVADRAADMDKMVIRGEAVRADNTLPDGEEGGKNMPRSVGFSPFCRFSLHR